MPRRNLETTGEVTISVPSLTVYTFLSDSTHTYMRGALGVFALNWTGGQGIGRPGTL